MKTEQEIRKELEQTRDYLEAAVARHDTMPWDAVNAGGHWNDPATVARVLRWVLQANHEST